MTKIAYVIRSETIVVALDLNWETSEVNGEISGQPQIADIDSDNQVEIVIGSKDGKVYGWELNGQSVVGWPKDTGYAVNGSLAVGDIDDEDDIEIISANFGGKLNIFQTDVEPIEIFLPKVSQ